MNFETEEYRLDKGYSYAMLAEDMFINMVGHISYNFWISDRTKQAFYNVSITRVELPYQGDSVTPWYGSFIIVFNVHPSYSASCYEVVKAFKRVAQKAGYKVFSVNMQANKGKKPKNKEV